MSDPKVEKNNFLDLKGLYCPVPYIKTIEALEGLSIGESLVVEATDPGYLEDIKAVEKIGTVRIVKFIKDKNKVTVVLKKSN